MKRKPRWTLEMLTASLAVLCGLLLLVLLVQRPTAWLLLAVLVVLWGIGATLFRCKLRSWMVRWTSGTTFEKSKVQFSLEPLSQPAALLSGETVLWYNSQFRTRLLGGQDVLASRVQKLLPGLDLQLCRKREQQKAKRCCREQEQNFSHLPNSVKDKAEFCFQKCFHISRSDFRSISASILPHTAPKTRFSCSYHTMFLSFCNPHSAFFCKSTPLHLPKHSGKRRFFFRTSRKRSA